MAGDHRSARALAAAERLSKRKPDASTEEFRKVCERADKSVISKLSNLQLNASHVLPFRRSAAMRKKGRSASQVAPQRKARPSGRRPRTNAQQQIAALLRKRDREVLAAAGDPMKAYEIASRIDGFAREVISLAKHKQPER